ncbi:MAG: gfo/Idh/MocA family oxidoreductase, partial [Planctomycetia bacterium]|nr:gfo/Idh/MocA family oxidoreductase [Planctomycetia bacterium]
MPTPPTNGSASTPTSSRRGFLAAGTAAVAALPTIVSARALGLETVAAASERITLGVIGIGNRCKYVLSAMLGLPDVQCVAIADVQATRRDAGKKLVDERQGNDDCRLYHDFRELLAR